VRLLLDQGVPRRAAELLREAGIDADHVGALGMSSAEDADILAWCREHGAVAVTLDADFHAAIALSGATSPSAVRLRVQGLKGPEVARLLLDIISERGAQLTAGALITVQHGRLRLRVLPVARKSG
jgi:predicted nuclease of predicted toxin-antitoxin system